jgi:regulator of RNase E activity RraA
VLYGAGHVGGVRCLGWLLLAHGGGVLVIATEEEEAAWEGELSQAAGQNEAGGAMVNGG